MSIMNPQSLDEQFAIADHISFLAGPGDLPIAEIRNTHASAAVAINGGQVLAYDPHGQEPVLWVSQHAIYEPGKAIRGGIPVCWPWFGPHPTDSSQPSHGFVRTHPWNVIATSIVGDGATQVRLGISDSDVSSPVWPHPFALQLVVTVGPTLEVELIIQNPGDAPFTWTGALHSYFNISCITDVHVHGLDGVTYIDKVDDRQRKVQQGSIPFAAETDNVYLDTEATCRIEDLDWRRSIEISKSGSRSTVVWNPWIAKSQSLSDFGNEEYLGMLCVETANAEDNAVTLAPGQEHRMRTVISTR